jgi:hypothetical protein
MSILALTKSSRSTSPVVISGIKGFEDLCLTESESGSLAVDVISPIQDHRVQGQIVSTQADQQASTTSERYVYLSDILVPWDDMHKGITMMKKRYGSTLKSSASGKKRSKQKRKLATDAAQRYSKTFMSDWMSKNAKKAGK